MAADGCPYATLGLQPGADAEAIKHAYLRLIKQFHPDRQGGDLPRAAEINRAYRELRLAGQVREALDLQHWNDPRERGTVSVRTAVLVLAAAGALTLVAAPMLAPGAPVQLGIPALPADVPEAGELENIEEPIAVDKVNGAVRDARRLVTTADEMALAKASRDCHAQLRQQPRLALLDHCAAFDSAAVQLLDRDPLRDRGPFSELAVTGRLMRAGQIFSDDYLAIDSRLDQIRLRVELALAPAPSPEGEAVAAAD